MESQIAIEEVLEELTHCNAEDLASTINKFQPQLTSSIENVNDHPEQSIKIACVLFKELLPKFQNVSDAETRMFAAFLPPVHKIFVEILESIRSKLENEATDLVLSVNRLLKVAISLLESIEYCLEYIKQKQQIEADEINIFLNNFGPIMIDALNHCFISQEVYGSYFDTAAYVLNIFFQRTYKIMLKYIESLKNNINFECKVSAQIASLCLVLRHLSEFGKLSPQLGVRATSETWKLYANLTTKYAVELQDHVYLKEPVINLSSEVVTILESVAKHGGEEKDVERSLKVASFLMRIVIKLCEQFPNKLDDSYPTLINFVLSLYRCSEYGIQMHGCRSPNALIDRILIVGTDPLIAHLVANPTFGKEVFKSKDTSDPASYLLLLICISRQVANLTEEKRNHWFDPNTPSNNLFHAMFTCIGQCQEFMNENYASKKQIIYTVYKMVLTALACLISLLNKTEQSVIEKTLISDLSKKHLTTWQCIFISDAWVILIRFSGSEICNNHLNHLIKIVQNVPTNQQRSVIINLIHRLSSILSVSLRPKIPEYISELKNAPLPHEQLNIIETSIQEFVNSSPTVSMYKNLITCLDSLCYVDVKCLLPIFPSLMNLWNFVNDSRLGKILASKLLCITSHCIENLNNEQILKVIRYFFDLSDQHLKLQAILIFTKLSKYEFQSDGYQIPIFECISSAYAHFLQDLDSVVQISALQSFDEFAHNTKHEIIVTQTVSESKDLQILITNHLKSKLFITVNNEHFAHFHKHIFSSFLILSEPEFSGNIKKVSNDFDCKEAQFKNTDNLPQQNAADLIAQLRSITNDLLVLHANSQVSQDEIRQLETISSELVNICGPFHDI